MGTTAIVARATPDGFTGRACHEDGHPAYLGRTLFERVRGPFGGDGVDAARHFVDTHPGGWARLVLDDGPDAAPDVCWCHDGRGVGPRRAGGSRRRWPPLTETDNEGDEAYAYVLDEDALTVLVRVADGWEQAAQVFWMDEPNWAEIDRWAVRIRQRALRPAGR